MSILQHIASIEADKQARKVWPTHALETELKLLDKNATEELNELARCGKIKMGHTINDRYITVIKP